MNARRCARIPVFSVSSSNALHQKCNENVILFCFSADLHYLCIVFAADGCLCGDTEEDYHHPKTRKNNEKATIPNRYWHGTHRSGTAPEDCHAPTGLQR
jgi:hypothetical protein